MVSGTLSTFERIWELVGSVSAHLELGSRLEQNDATYAKEIEKLNSELFKIRNSQMSMVKFNSLN